MTAHGPKPLGRRVLPYDRLWENSNGLIWFGLSCQLIRACSARPWTVGVIPNSAVGVQDRQLEAPAAFIHQTTNSHH